VYPPCLSPEKLSDLITRFPDFHFVENTSGTPHPHGFAAAERALMERRAFALAKTYVGDGKIVDIGGNPARHFGNGRSIWSCCPTLSPADACRAARNMGVPNWCNHTVQECNCVTPLAYLSIDSLYYLSVEDVATLVHKSTARRLLATVHPHLAPLGGRFRGEYTWSLGDDGNVVVAVTGNAGAYSHSPCLWLEDGYFDFGENSIAWSIKSCTVDTYLYEFVPAPPGLPLPEKRRPSFRNAVVDSSFYGDVLVDLANVSKASVPEYEGFEIPDARVLSFGDQLITISARDKKVIVPKELIRFGAEYISMKPRDEVTFQSLLANIKRHRLTLKLSSDTSPLSIAYAAALSFVMHAREEAGIMNTIVAPQHGFFGVGPALNRALRFSFGWNIHGKITRLVVALAAVLFIRRRPFWGFAAVVLAMRLYTHHDRLTELVKAGFRLFNITGESFTTNRIGVIPLPVARVASHTSQKPLEPVHSSATVTPPAEFIDKKREEVVLTTLVTTPSIPIVPSTSTQNELVAVTNRGCFARPEPNPDIFRLYKAWTQRWFHVLFPGAPVKVKGSYTAWNKRFPLTQRLRHDKARAVLREQGHGARDFIRKSFMKKEKLLKSHVGGVEDFNPRLIQGATDFANVALGPWMHAFSEYLKVSWDTNHFICYSSGMSAEAVGEWFDRQEGLGFTDDARYWDSSLGEKHLKHEQMIYRQFDPPEKAKAVLRQQLKTKGFTPHGVRYSVDGTRKSGDPNTTCGNSIENGLQHTFSFCLAKYGDSVLKKNPAKAGITMIVAGDDNVGFVHHDDAEILSEVEQHMSALGISPKFRIHPDKATMDFCSSLFMPAIHPESGERVVILTPKIGRLLAKFGTTIKNPRVPLRQVRGDALGIAQDLAHCPVSRRFVAAALRCSRGHTPTQAQPYDHKMHATRAYELHPEAYDVIEANYSITRLQCDELERFLDSIDIPQCVIQHPVVDMFVAVDAS